MITIHKSSYLFSSVSSIFQEKELDEVIHNYDLYNISRRKEKNNETTINGSVTLLVSFRTPEAKEVHLKYKYFHTPMTELNNLEMQYKDY